MHDMHMEAGVKVKDSTPPYRIWIYSFNAIMLTLQVCSLLTPTI